MDPMSDILGMLRPSAYGLRGLDAAGGWAIDFPSAAGIKCYALQSGSCWLEVDGAPSIMLGAGDLALLAGREKFRLYSDPTVPAVNGFVFFPSLAPGETAVLNGGGEVTGMGGFFEIESNHAGILLSLLPPFVHIRAGATDGELIAPIARLMSELRSPRPGGELLARHLIQALLIEALRLHLVDGPEGAQGWLYALSDPRICAAMTAMHAKPARRWTLEGLAGTAGMSRTSFAIRFRDLLGEPVMEYLTRWRMLLAADELRTGRKSIAGVAASVGYESESAFGAAFKRVFGQPPRRFAKARPDEHRVWNS